jgi:ActR/RegA family two-component response regulator
MAIGLALLVSADPVTIQEFSHALRQLSISPEICQEVPAAIGLLKYRKFDAVIVDLQLGEQSASSNDGKAITAVRKRSGFAFKRPLSKESIPAHSNLLSD